MWAVNTVCIIVLMAINTVGDRFGKVFLAGLVIAGLFDLYTIDLTVREWSIWGWRYSWQNFAVINSVLPLNAWLWLRYKKAADI